MPVFVKKFLLDGGERRGAFNPTGELFTCTYLHSRRNKEGSDHDSSSCHEVREGIDEGSHAKSLQNEIVK